MANQKIYFRNETGIPQIFYNPVHESIKLEPMEIYVLDPNKLIIMGRFNCDHSQSDWIAAALRTKLREL